MNNDEQTGIPEGGSMDDEGSSRVSALDELRARLEDGLAKSG
ncbi:MULTISPECIES: hypothetical protein [unclassified Streptomyces]